MQQNTDQKNSLYEHFSHSVFDSFRATDLFLYSVSVGIQSEWSYNSDVSRGYRKNPVAWYGLKILQALRTQIYWKIFGASVFL